ncbi:MAG: hypothetical protein K9L72_02650 [Candidatus Omnitrophica bacterium]|nr:hypothetical protein [Candidatus Omnitrophota bacterium]
MFCLFINRFRGEERRIGSIINWRNRVDYKNNEFGYAKVKINNIESKAKKQNNFDVEASKKSVTLVISQSLKKESKSENLVRTLSTTIIQGYLIEVKRFLTPELSQALNNIETIKKLTLIKDHLAEKTFRKEMVVDDPVQKMMDILYEFQQEGTYEIFILYLLSVRKYKSITTSQEAQIKRDIINFVEWLSDDKDRRLTDPFSSEYFPKVQFLYVKREGVEVNAHINRAIKDFETEKCDIIILWNMSRSKVKKELRYISKSISKLGYSRFKEFKSNFGDSVCIMHIKDNNLFSKLS